MIFEIKKYADDEGRQVNAKIATSQDIDTGITQATTYSGTIGIRTPMGMMPLNFDFPEGLSLEKCFEKFDELAKETVQKIQDSSRIIPSASMPASPKNSGIIVP